MKEYRLYYIEAGSLRKINFFERGILPNPIKGGGFDDHIQAMEAANIISKETNKEVMVQRYLDVYKVTAYYIAKPKAIGRNNGCVL